MGWIITQKGQIHCFGNNNFGELGLGTSVKNYSFFRKFLSN
jgi:alpha-tubulin suppressor-like RCC1 family protein